MKSAVAVIHQDVAGIGCEVRVAVAIEVGGRHTGRLPSQLVARAFFKRAITLVEHDLDVSAVVLAERHVQFSVTIEIAGDN